jgi:hypothetical protein
MTTRELLAAFLNDLNNECLTRWGSRGEHGQAGSLPDPPPGTTALQPPATR